MLSLTPDNFTTQDALLRQLEIVRHRFVESNVKFLKGNRYGSNKKKWELLLSRV
jgi:hypothetical protein